MWKCQTTDTLPGLEEEGLRQLYPTGSDVGELSTVVDNDNSIACVGFLCIGCVTRHDSEHMIRLLSW